MRKIAIFSCFLFTSFCFWKAGVGLIGGADAVILPSVQAAVHPSFTRPQVVTTPIQEMRPGMRVVGRNPLRWDTQSAVEPDPVSWRLVSVRMEQQQPGQFVLGQLLRPLSWIRQNNALPSAVIQLEIPEMHVAGEAEVLSIADCPPIRRGPGSVVTGTFQHVSDEVISVFVEGESEPIGTTSQHPFWSRDRNAFVPAGELRIGEELKTALGTSTRVTSIEIRAGPETVYGLEVSGEHVYQITNAGLLVHNASGNTPRKSMPQWLRDRLESGNEFNRANRPRYPYNEVQVDIGGKKKYVVDSYDLAAREIVSRKYTQLADVKENTAIGYFQEFVRKYPGGATITNSPFNPKRFVDKDYKAT